MKFIISHVVETLPHDLAVYTFKRIDVNPPTLLPPQPQPRIHTHNAPNKIPIIIATHPVAHNNSNTAIAIKRLARSIDTTIANLMLLHEIRHASRI